MAWTTLTFAFGSLLTSTKMTQLYDNLTALANGDSGAPNILPAAINVGYAPGSYFCFNQHMEGRTGTSDFAQMLEMKTGIAGNISIGFYARSATADAISVRPYLNGAAVSSAYTTTSSAFALVVREVQSCSINDKIQLWGKYDAGATVAAAKNLGILCNTPFFTGVSLPVTTIY